MKGLVRGVIVAVVLCAGVSVASAQEEVPTQKITIGELEIFGQARDAQVVRMRAQDRARFERLGTLKRSVLSRVLESGQDQALER